MQSVDSSSRLAALRAQMKERRVDIYVIPSGDSHSSEYIAECDARREYISGFTGSAGTAVVTLEKAALATDGRYFNQASKQLDHNWLLLKTGLQDVPTWQEWTAEESTGGKTVAVDPSLVSSTIAKKLQDSIKKKGGAGLTAVTENLVDLVWGSSRPARPREPVMVLPLRYAGKDTNNKLTELRQALVKKQVAGLIVSMLDEVAWLFNLRGNDIPFNPVFFSYAIITSNTATLYVDEKKLGSECQTYLSENGVIVKPYESFLGDTEALASSAEANARSGAETKYILSDRASWAIKLAFGGEKFVEEMRSPVGDAKSVKNEVELEGMRQCHVRDGAAITEFFAWLEDQLIEKKATLDEVAAADKLEEIRKRQQDFMGLSFPTISSTGANAAVIHYKPEPGHCSTLNPNAVYLCDSGAQFLDGTTDTTRTLHFGTPTVAEKRAYTLVLKGNIALDTVVFPKGTTGYTIDCLARQFLWKAGLDYRHGTGHGVGSFLNVHEGPIGIGARKHYLNAPFVPGHVTSIEPGYYEDGSFGIRIENIAIVREVTTEHSFGDKPFLGFEHVTMVPYCRKLIETGLLTGEEKNWLNDYSADIRSKLEGFFHDDPLTKAWLIRETEPY